MALISCKECNNIRSDKARCCPYCGIRVLGKNTTITNPYKGKAKIVIGKALLLLGVLLVFSGLGSGGVAVSIIGVLLLIFGFIILVTGRIQHWWHWK